MSSKVNKKLNIVNVATMYLGVVMGAGYASGRESWQFIGVYGPRALPGAAIAAVLFAVIAYMIAYLAIRLESEDIGTIICVVPNERISAFISNFMAAMLYMIIVSMTAAGGALMFQQFGLPRPLGGAIIALLVAITILGDFQRISSVFKYIVPPLFLCCIISCILVLLSDIQQSGPVSGYKGSELIPNLTVGVLMCVAFNMTGTIPIGASAARNAISPRIGRVGSFLGGAVIGIMTFLLIVALQRDMAFTAPLDLPMLGYAGRISPVLGILYVTVLCIAIYSSATSVFYGFTSRIPEGPKKKYIIVAAIIAGYLAGLMGFKTIVAYIYPIQAYFCLFVIFMLIVNFCKVLWQDITRKKG